MARRDPYEILGLPKGASDDEIKRAFRALARACHPDVAGPESAGQFQEIRAAYETLSDPEARSRYERRARWRASGGRRFEGFEGFGGFGGGARRAGGRRPRGAEPDPRNDIGLDDIFSGGFGFGGGAAERPRPRQSGPPRGGDDVSLTVEISSTMATRGGVVEVRYPRRQRSADGLSLETRPEVFSLRIHPGARSGEVLRVDRMGHAGDFGGIAGDLLCALRIADAPTGEAWGAAPWADEPEAGAASTSASSASGAGTPDDPAELTVPMSRALLGGRVQVETPRGRVFVTLPPCTAGGSKLRLKGRQVDGGDYVLRVRIAAPEALTPELRALAEALESLGS